MISLGCGFTLCECKVFWHFDMIIFCIYGFLSMKLVFGYFISIEKNSLEKSKFLIFQTSELNYENRKKNKNPGFCPGPCARGRIRTLNPRSRNPIFYPIELRTLHFQLLLRNSCFYFFSCVLKSDGRRYFQS